MSVDGMKPDLESPLQQREIQWTLLSLASIILVAVLVPWNTHERFDQTISTDAPRAGGVVETGDATGVQIDINHAHAYELALLPGVGPILADRIVEDRDRNGEFISIEGLRRVFGIGEKTIVQISRLCVVGKDPISRVENAESDELSR
jgi:competence protein ComEA